MEKAEKKLSEIKDALGNIDVNVKGFSVALSGKDGEITLSVAIDVGFKSKK